VFALVAKFARGVFEGRLRVAIAITTVGAGELAVDVDRDAGFASAGAGFVGGKNSRSCGGDDECFFFGEEAKRDADGLVLRGEKRSFAVESVNEDAA